MQNMDDHSAELTSSSQGMSDRVVSWWQGGCDRLQAIT